MGIGSSTVVMARRSEEQAFEVQLALAGFLTGYSGNTRLAYQQDLRQFVSWCSNQDLGLLGVRRTLELTRFLGHPILG
jgi:site-specific recombinase XerD